MSIYSLANLTTGVTAATAALEVRSTSTDRAALLEFGAWLNAATASTYGIGRPAARGVTPTSPITWLAEDENAPAGTIQTALAWGTGPTVPANFFRRIGLPATIGAGFLIAFPRGLIMAVSASVVLWNIGTDGAVNTHVAGDE
jgi:hypothetical protein